MCSIEGVKIEEGPNRPIRAKESAAALITPVPNGQCWLRFTGQAREERVTGRGGREAAGVEREKRGNAATRATKTGGTAIWQRTPKKNTEGELVLEETCEHAESSPHGWIPGECWVCVIWQGL